MAVSRRQFLIGGGLAAAATTLGLAGCGGSKSGGSADGSADLQFTWWGNDVRNKNTNAAIAAYMAANPKVKIGAQSAEWAAYWDKLATQTAGNTSPDVIQMDMAYISEYSSRGALADLSKYGADTSKFAEGTVDSGKINGTLFGINAGINTPTILANPTMFEKAKMDLPDDSTWTWEQAMETSAELTSKLGGGLVGMGSFFGTDAFLSAFLRQNGKQLFVDKALGFEAADVVPWFEMMVKWESAKAIPPAAQISEDATKAIDQGNFATGKVAMSMFWSNQVEAVNAASKETMKILRFPSTTGKAADRQAWYKASMLWSVSARSKNPEAAAALVNWWVNSTDAAGINLAERGIPANTEVLSTITPQLSPAQQGVAKFIAEIKPELGPTPIAPVPGGGTLANVLLRYGTDVLFGRSSTTDAATKFVDEIKSNLTV